MYIMIDEGGAGAPAEYEPTDGYEPFDMSGLGRFRIKKPKFARKLLRPIKKIVTPPKFVTKIATKVLAPPKPLQKFAARLPGGKAAVAAGALAQKVIARPTMVLRPKAFTREVEQVVRMAPGGKQLVKLKGFEKKLHTMTGKFVRKNMGAIGMVVSVVGYVFPILKPIGAALSAGAVARKAAQARKDARAEKQAIAEQERMMADAVQQLVNEGIPPDQAAAIVQRMGAGEDMESAVQAVMGDQPLQLTKPVAKLTPEAARQEFLAWAQGWRPNAHAAAMAMAPELAQPFEPESMPISGLANIDPHTGDWDFSVGLQGLGEIDWSAAITNFVNTASNVYGTVMKTKMDKQAMQIQLDRMKSGLPPAPTQQVEAQAQNIVKSEQRVTGAAPGFALSPTMMLALAGAGVGVWMLMGGRRGRRR